MESVRTVLREADQMENYGAHLCAVARNMMELFHVIYASIHQKEAQELPYLAGTELAATIVLVMTMSLLTRSTSFQHVHVRRT